ncbi:amidohydrolase family protein [Steroidobacter sp.]|uniref:amidohydrolase family protein n=1 Tax=Steroidobacter sp. TaxID=1978227 RepID=UPI001A4C95DD|nr:amidohydrolase family protein [Steroidobacter sp.]MBL8266257.1 PD40 domain-containing protein [Steroidobacter sp.]
MKSFILAAAAAVTLSSSLPASASSEATAFEPLPLQGHTQPLNFSVETGTWMSVDATPDGKELVFDLLGDLYTLPATGGTAVPLTRGLPFDTQPRISPDGQWLAFVSDRDGDDNLWVMRRADGELRRLSQVHGGFAISPSWTPDSKRVLVAESLAHLPPDSTFRFYSLTGEASDVKDKDGKPIIGSGGILSRDGRYLYFAYRDAGDEGRYGMPIAQIRRLDLSRGTVETLTNGQGGGTRPALSADGKRLVYATREEGKTVLRERDLESGAERLVTRSVQQDRQDYGRGLRGDQLPGYVLRDADQSLLLSAGGKLQRIGLRDGHATEIPFRADVSLDIGPRLHKPYRVEQGPLTARIVQSPSFSPDGQHIAASILTKLYVMPARAGALPKRVTKGDALEYQPVWSPDGKWLAYVVWSREGGHVWKVHADGSNAQRLTSHPAFYTDLVFSPDGQRILALRGSEQMWTNTPESANFRLPLDLVWMPAGGGSVQTIATGYSGRYPHFSSDSERIYTTDAHALYSIRYDGSDQRTHLKLSGRFEPRSNSQPTAERLIVSADGREALASINKQVWRLPLPPQGEPNVTIDSHAGMPGAMRLTDVGADFFGWARGGKAIFWAVGSTVYRVAADKSASVANVSSGLRESAPAVESFAVQLHVPRAAPKGSLVLRGANVIPMSAAAGASVLEGADIVITDNRIVAIGPVGTVNIPSDARIVDVTGKYIVPGFIDTHAHWRFASREIQDPDNWSLRINLAYGVTAGLDVQSNHGENFIYQDLVEAGQTLGTRAFMVGPGVFGINNYKTFETDFQSYEETLAYLRRYQQHYRTHNIKVYLAGNRRQREWIVLACQELGLMPTTEGFGDPFMDLSHAIDGMHGSEHAMIDSALYDDVVQTFARTETTYTPTLNITHYGLAGAEYFFAREDLQNDAKLNRFYPRNRLRELTARRGVWANENEFSFRVMAAQAAKIQRAGGLVGVGSHGELQGLGYHWELEMMARGGMQPNEILRAATIDGAKIIGIEQDLGSLEAGKLADLVVLRANPLQTIGNAKEIAYVMQNGVLYDGETLSVTAPSTGVQRPASTQSGALPRRPN